MEIRQDYAGKVQPIEFKNLIAPGECLLCKRIGRQPSEIFADLHVELEFYGVAYLCTDCCMELANFVGAVDSDVHKRLKTEYHTLVETLATMTKQIEYLKGLLNARIDSVGGSESFSDGDASLPLFEVDSPADSVDRILNEYESEPVKSGKG